MYHNSEQGRALLVADDEEGYHLFKDHLSHMTHMSMSLDWEQDPQKAFPKMVDNEYGLYFMAHDPDSRDKLDLMKKAIAKGCHQPVIFVTNTVDYDVDGDVMRYGAADVITKEFLQPQYLERVIRYALERSRQKKILREGEERLGILMSLAPVGLFLVSDHGEYLYVNEQWSLLTGCSLEEAVGMDWLEIVQQEDREFVQARWNLWVSSGQPFVMEFRIMNAAQDEDIWVLGQLKVFTGHAGELVGYLGSLTDITAKRRKEDMEKREEERVRTIVNNALDAVVMMNHEGIVTFWSDQAERVFGWTRGEAVGRLMTDTIVPPQYHRGHTQGVKRFMETGKGTFINRRIEITARHKEGHELPVELSIVPLKEGAHYTFSAFIRDITERRKAEDILKKRTDELEKMNKMMIGRELKMLALKKEIQRLQAEHIR